MSFTDKQRKVLIEERGEPILRLEFDVFEGNKVSMWTHFNHSEDYKEVKLRMLAIKAHLDEFIKDEKMCPFHKPNLTINLMSDTIYKYSFELQRMREVSIFDNEYKEPPLGKLWWVTFIVLWVIDLTLLVYLINSK